MDKTRIVSVINIYIFREKYYPFQSILINYLSILYLILDFMTKILKKMFIICFQNT